MKRKFIVLVIVAWAGYSPLAFCQGVFQNFNFEAANVAGYAPGSSSSMNLAFPGWNATLVGFTPIYYDAVSLGGAMLTIYDTNNFLYGGGYIPLQGRFSAILFGGWPGPPQLWQTGVVPAGTRSLRMDIGNLTTHFSVSLGGQALNMVPLQSFPNYSVYGADITGFAGQTATLSLTTAPVPGDIPPSWFVVDDIRFSPQPIPEPGSVIVFFSGCTVTCVVAISAETGRDPSITHLFRLTRAEPKGPHGSRVRRVEFGAAKD